jgi:hypothetical protein
MLAQTADKGMTGSVVGMWDVRLPLQAQPVDATLS